MKEFLIKRKNFNFLNLNVNFPQKIKWVTNNIFLIILEKLIIISRCSKTTKTVKFKKLFCHSKICDIEFSLSNKLMIISNRDGCVQTKFRNSLAKFQIFFFNFTLNFFRFESLKKKLIFGSTTFLANENLIFNQQKKNSFMIFNLEEGRFFEIYDLGCFLVGEDTFCQIKSKGILILVIKKNIIFFKINWFSKKICKKKIKNESEILSIKYFSRKLIFLDKNGDIFITEKLRREKFLKKKGKNFFIPNFLPKKFKISFPRIFSKNFDFCKKNELIINFSFPNFFVKLDLNKKKKKKIKFLNPKIKFFDIKTNNKNNSSIALTIDFYIFIIKKGFRWILGKSDIFEGKILSKNSFFFEYQKYNKIQFVSFPFLSKKLYGVFGFDQGYTFLDFRREIKKSKISENFLSKIFPPVLGIKFTIVQDYIGQKIFICCDSSIFKIYTKKTNFIENKNHYKSFSKNFLKKNKIVCSTIDCLGMTLGLLFKNGEIKIYETRILFKKKEKYQKYLYIKKKNNKIISISKNGFFLGVINLSIITLWQIFPQVKKIHSCDLNFLKKINYFKCFEFENNLKFLICSKKEIGIYDMSKNRMVKKVNLDVLDVELDRWSGKFIVMTKYFFLKENKKKIAFIVFKEFSFVPLIVLDTEKITNNFIIGLKIFYLNDNQRKCFLVTDSLLKFYKIYF